MYWGCGNVEQCSVPAPRLSRFPPLGLLFLKTRFDLDLVERPERFEEFDVVAPRLFAVRFAFERPIYADGKGTGVLGESCFRGIEPPDKGSRDNNVFNHFKSFLAFW